MRRSNIAYEKVMGFSKNFFFVITDKTSAVTCSNALLIDINLYSHDLINIWNPLNVHLLWILKGFVAIVVDIHILNHVDTHTGMLLYIEKEKIFIKLCRID